MEHDRYHQRPEEPEPSGGVPEHEQAPYVQAAWFQCDRAAGHAYQRVQDLVYRGDVDLSVFRFQAHDLSHVAVIGDTPPDQMQQQIERILATGVLTPLRQDVVALLVARRRQAQQLGPWVEGHYRPGMAVRLPKRQEDTA